MTDELAASGAQLEGGRRRAAVPGFEPRSVCPQSFGPSSLEKVRTGSVKNTKVLLSEIEEGPEETPEGFVSG